jgi:hypothetical protein
MAQATTKATVVVKATVELRCGDGHLHGMVNSAGLLEVKCQKCASGMKGEVGYGVVVFHYFDLKTAQLVDTRVFRDVRELIKLNGGNENE